MGVSGIAAFVSRTVDCVESGTYYVARAVGSGMQVLSTAFIAQQAWNYAQKPQQDSFWSTKASQASSVQNWVAAPMTGLSDYVKFNPVMVAGLVFGAESLLTLMGRSSIRDKVLDRQAEAQIALTEATSRYSRALIQQTTVLQGHTAAVNASTAAAKVQAQTITQLMRSEGEDDGKRQ